MGVLELGGKSASLLLPDIDIDAACARPVQWSIGVMAGQGCALPTIQPLAVGVGHDEVMGRPEPLRTGDTDASGSAGDDRDRSWRAHGLAPALGTTWRANVRFSGCTAVYICYLVI